MKEKKEKKCTELNKKEGKKQTNKKDLVSAIDTLQKVLYEYIVYKYNSYSNKTNQKGFESCSFDFIKGRVSMSLITSGEESFSGFVRFNYKKNESKNKINKQNIVITDSKCNQGFSLENLINDFYNLILSYCYSHINFKDFVIVIPIMCDIHFKRRTVSITYDTSFGEWPDLVTLKIKW